MNVDIPSRRIARRGSVMTLMTVLLPAVFVLAAVCINAAHVQLTHTEMMIATDAAAKAGGRALSEFQSIDTAADFAVQTAQQNLVNGQPLQLRRGLEAGDLEFGKMVTSGNNRYQFVKIPVASIRSGSDRPSALRVNAKRNAGSLSGAVPLLMPGFQPSGDFDSARTSIAMQVDRDIALVLDQSGSMASVYWNWPPGKNPYNAHAMRAAVDAGVLFDGRPRGISSYRLTGNYHLPAGTSVTDYWGWVWQSYYQLGPPPVSLWEEMQIAVERFLGALEETTQDEKVSISTYASSSAVRLNLTSSYPAVRNRMRSIGGPSGMTAIGRGMQSGFSTLGGAGSRPYAAKTIVVMTDGQHNTGIDPVTVAHQICSSSNVTIHSITFGSGADTNRMRQIAEIGGGEYYHAANGAELIEVFRKIANNLPTILVQ